MKRTKTENGLGHERREDKQGRIMSFYFYERKQHSFWVHYSFATNILQNFSILNAK